MDTAKVHQVHLVGLQGREKAVGLQVAGTAVRLFKDSQSLDSFPYEAIIKWLPSTQRSYNPGSADCFDLQLETPRGPRDLRIRAGNPEQVTSILGEIEGTVLQLVAARTAANAGLTAGSGQVADTLHTQSANQPSAVERAQLGSLSGNAGSEAAPLSQRSTRQSRDWEAGRAKVRESLQAGIAGQAHAASEDRPGAEYVAVTNNINRAAEQSSVASSPEPWPEPERGAAAVGSTAYKSTGHGPIEAAEPSSSGSAATPTAHAGRTPSSTYYPATGPMARPGVRQGRDSLQRVDSVSSEGSSSKGDDTQADTATTRQVMVLDFGPLGYGLARISPQPLAALTDQQQRARAKQQQQQQHAEQAADSAGRQDQAQVTSARSQSSEDEWPTEHTPQPAGHLKSAYDPSASPAAVHAGQYNNDQQQRNTQVSTNAGAAGGVPLGQDLSHLAREAGQPGTSLQFSPLLAHQQHIQQMLPLAVPAAQVAAAAASKQTPRSPLAGMPRRLSTGLYSASAGLPRLALPPPIGVRRTLSDTPVSKETEIGSPPSRATMVLGMQTSPFQPQIGTSEADLQVQVRVLEDLVTRLSAQLPTPAAHSPAFDLPIVASVSNAGPLPPWLTDSKLLPPLLLAYDEQLAAKDAAAAEAASTVRELQAQMDDLKAANSALLKQNKDLQSMSSAPASGLPPARDTNSGLAKRQELLAEENALLLQQQASLESQLGQLQAKLLARSGEVVQLSQEAAGLTAQLQERNAALARLERQVERSQAAYESSEEQCGELEMDLARALEALQREQQNADALHQLQSQLVAEAAARQEAAEEAARLSGELGAVAQLREEAEAAIEEVAELRSTTASVEALLEEVQARDAKNQELLAIASAAAEEAVAARNILASKVKIMEAEAAALHSRLADLQGAQQQAERLQAQLDASHKALKAADDELVALRAQVLEQKVAAERNGREQGSLQAQMTELKEACEATGLVSQRTGLAHGSLAALEALHAAEAGRDAAVQRAYNAQMAHEREQRQWELQRQQLETTVAELRHSVMDLEGSLATAKATGASTSRQLDSVRAELTAVQQTRHDVEGSLRLQLAAAQAEAAAAGRLVASHHDGRLDGHARSAAELDRILDAKDALLDKYREEASHATAELASLKAHYDREKQAAQQATSSMESEIQRLRIDISRLAERAEQASAAESALRPNLEDAERRAAQAVLRMTAALAQEEAAVRARKELHLQLDRAQLEQSRAERQRDAALSSNESLRRQCEALQDVALMGQPNRYETSLGGQFGSAEKMLKAKRHKASNKRSRRHADAGRPLQEVQLGA